MRWLLVLSMLLLGVAPHASGAAPANWEEAQEVPFGAIEGSFWMDDEDWYRVRVPDGSAVHVAVQGPCPFGDTPYDMEIRADDGTLVFRQTAACEWLGAAIQTTRGTGDWMRIGLLAKGSWGSYSISLVAIPAPDVSVVAVVWNETSIPNLRTVTGLVSGSGDHGPQELTVSAWTSHPVGGLGIRELGTRLLTLYPGQTVAVEFSWDTLGEVGATEVHVEALPAVDRNLLNNRGTAQSSVLVGTDAGLDPLNSDLAAPMTSVSTRYGPARTGTGAYLLGATANAWLTPETLVVCARAAAQAACPGEIDSPVLP